MPTGIALAGLAGRGVLVAASIAALGLAGCGRKSGLDAPPLAVADDQQAGQPGSTPGKPNAPVTEKRHTLLDWLID